MKMTCCNVCGNSYEGDMSQCMNCGTDDIEVIDVKVVDIEED